MATQQRISIALSLVVSGILAGCSGGGGNNNNNPPTGNNPPPMLTGDTFGVTNANRLVSFSSATPSNSAAVAITGLANGENILAVDRRPGGTTPGQIYAITDQFNVYTIDPSSGAASLKSRMTAAMGDDNPFTRFTGTRISIDVNNFVDQLRVIGNDGQNLRVMLDTGQTFSDANMTIGGNAPTGVSEVAYTNNFAAACRNTVFYIDTSTDSLMTSVNASAGILTRVGPLGFDAQAIAGFDILTNADGSQTAFAALSVMGTTSLYTINLMSGAATLVGAIGALNTGETIVGLALPVPATAPAQAVGELLALTDNNGLVSFQSGFPSKLCTSTTISGLQGNESVLGIDVRPSDRNVYAVTSGGRLYTVNATAGTATTVATLTADPQDNTDPYTIADLNSGIAMDVSPAADQLRVFNGNGKNLRVNLNTGVTTSDVQLSAAGLSPANAGVTAISYTNGFAGTLNNTLYLIDTANDRLLTTPAGASGGVLANVGSLRIQGDVQAVAGLEINAVNNSAFAALQVGTAAGNTSDLYSIDLTSGAATRVGPIGATARVRKITYASPPVATLVGITTNNQLVTFGSTNPGTLTSSMPITGMQGGEMPAGLDIRPSNQTAYILSNGARIYTLNQTTGMATLTGSLIPASGSGFSRLLGANFGTDFSPPADALRIYTDAEQNLAVLADSGQVALQATSLTRPNGDINAGTAPDIFAIAYTNNYANALATVLYSIDGPTNSLVSTNPANGGVLNTVGRLTTTSTTMSFTLTGDLDIVGGDNGLALAALQPLNANQSTLYSVNLQTGLLTPIGAIGPAGTQPLIGFTIRFQ
jgi:trimeric autotransporter adhesin